MIIVVDTNILFSACLTPNNRIFQILQNPDRQLHLISQTYALDELHLHKEKLLKLSNRSAHEMDILINTVLKQIDFFDAELIDPKFWIEADDLTKDVDSKDISFVALSLKSGGLLWTGDKKLINHLRRKNYDKVINTTELCNILNID